MILANIAQEKALVEEELVHSMPGSDLDRIMFNSAKQQLSNQVIRCNMLHEALTQQKGQFKQILDDTRKQHKSQITQLEGLVSSSQELVRKQTMKYKDQVDKLVKSDMIIEQLIVDNDILTGKLYSLKGQLKVTDSYCDQ